MTGAPPPGQQQVWPCFVFYSWLHMFNMFRAMMLIQPWRSTRHVESGVLLSDSCRVQTAWASAAQPRRPGTAGGAPDVEVTLSPEELEGLDNEGIRALYDAKMAAAQQAAKAEREDFSDMVARHAASQKRKIAERAETRAAKKQKDSFKF
eukprot:GHRQ01018275.1.p2 GENE.GHRQ01018275.1~~GHRQ01018275.1.p2  ORF type:complete len:150 (+),score=31.29 GHRQ01018275.1:863-1312(+)